MNIIYLETNRVTGSARNTLGSFCLLDDAKETGFHPLVFLSALNGQIKKQFTDAPVLGSPSLTNPFVAATRYFRLPASFLDVSWSSTLAGRSTHEEVGQARFRYQTGAKDINMRPWGALFIFVGLVASKLLSKLLGQFILLLPLDAEEGRQRPLFPWGEIKGFFCWGKIAAKHFVS